MKYNDGRDEDRKQKAENKRYRIRQRNLRLVYCGGMKKKG